MATAYFPVSKLHLTDNYVKENSNNDCVLNVKNLEISNFELGQNFSNGRFIQALNLQEKDIKELIEMYISILLEIQIFR